MGTSVKNLRLGRGVGDKKKKFAVLGATRPNGTTIFFFVKAFGRGSTIQLGSQSD